MSVFGVIPVCIFLHLDWIRRDGVSFRIQSKCGKIRTRVTSNMDTFHEVSICRSRNPTFHFVPTFPKYNLQRNIFVVRIFRSYPWKRTVSLESAGCMFSFTMQPKSNISFLLFFFFSFFFAHRRMLVLKRRKNEKKILKNAASMRKWLFLYKFRENDSYQESDIEFIFNYMQCISKNSVYKLSHA